jgi:hypothetical protein
VRGLNPEKVFFVLGRAKDEGLFHVLADALHRTERSFDVVALLASTSTGEEANARAQPRHPITHIRQLQEGFVLLPRRLVEFAKEQGGEIIAIGGGAFTRDIILTAKHEGAPLLVLASVGGASAEKSGVLSHDAQAQSGDALLRLLLARRPQWRE